MSSSAPEPLIGFSVLEIGGTLTSAYAGRLLCDLGATVLAAEFGGGSDLWDLEPCVAGSEISAICAYLHHNKVICNFDGSEGDLAHLMEVARGMDIVLIDVDSAVVPEAWVEELSASVPRTVVARMSDFGTEGPQRGRKGGDLIVQAFSGMSSIICSTPADATLMSPLRYRGNLTSALCAAHAVLGALGAVFARLGHGWGDVLDVSGLEAVIGSTATAIPAFSYSGVTLEASVKRAVGPWAIFTCRDGRFLMQVTEDAQWRALVELLGNPEWALLELFDKNADRIENFDVLLPLVAEALSEVELEDFLQRANDARVPVSRVLKPTEVLQWHQLLAREFFTPILTPDGGEVLAPSTPLWIGKRLQPSERRASRAKPAAAVTEIRPLAPLHKGDEYPTGELPPPLEGCRVLDLTWVWAGPYATMLLGALGAEVIKVESQARVDVTRVLGPWADLQDGFDRSGFFNQFNMDKSSVCVNPTVEEGRKILTKLVAESDMIVDNMRPGALHRMGFGTESLRQMNSQIIPVSMTGFGSSGPEADRLAYGSLIDASSGMVEATGPVGGPASEVPMSLPDPCSGLHAAIAMVGALIGRKRHGIASEVESAMVESWIAALPWAVLEASATGAEPTRIGARDDRNVPHGFFRCAGSYEWVAVSVRDDEEFARLFWLLGEGDVPDNWKGRAARRRMESEIESFISNWTISRTKEQAEAQLLAAGVPASRVRTFPEVVGCEHLAEVGFFVELDHPAVGRRKLSGPGWRYKRAQRGPFRSAPTFGQHTDEVIQALGLDVPTIENLKNSKVLW